MNPKAYIDHEPPPPKVCLYTCENVKNCKQSLTALFDVANIIYISFSSVPCWI